MTHHSDTPAQPQTLGLGRRILNRAIGLARLSPTAAAGLFIIVFFALLAGFAPWLMPHDPIASYPDRVLQAPSATHWFGIQITKCLTL